jgi:hypothetical protein
MKKPMLRVTKWLKDIPVEGCCSLCPESLFRASSPHHRPQKAEYTKSLELLLSAMSLIVIGSK